MFYRLKDRAMKERKKISEKTKNVIIALLVLSAVFLGWQSGLFGNASLELSMFADLFGRNNDDSGTNGTQSVGDKAIGEARPVSIAVTGSTGAHYGAKYELSDIDEAYNKTVKTFKEALGSAHSPISVGEEEWRAALLSPGVCYEYLSPSRLSILSGWYGTEITSAFGDKQVRRLCVASVDGRNRLYFQDDLTGLFYAADTAIGQDSVVKLTETFSANNVVYVFESIGAQQLEEPYTLLFPDVMHHPVIEAKNPLSDENTQIEALRELGVSEHLKPIPIENGRAYIDENFRIELSPGGVVSYRRTSSKDASSDYLAESEAVEMARQAVSAAIGRYSGAARIYFDDIQPIGAGGYQVMFQYVIAGGPIYLGQNGYAATVTIEDGFISEMELLYRSYAISATAEPIKLFPEIQAAAASGGAFMLGYADNGSDRLLPAWVNTSPDS